MPASQMNTVIQHLHKTLLVQVTPDAQLLENFVNRREEAALEALVRRHGPMVWNVCRRVLRNHQDAEDAFQATFLVFVHKAASIVPREMVGNWLYGVAHQTALKANATATKRRTREKQVTAMPEPTMTEQEHWTDLQPILDQEVSRLPDKYRVVIVLCDLEGKTRSQAAQQLGWPEGTVAGRLARARTTLAKRLTQQGIVLSGGSLAAVLSQQTASACVPPGVVTTTIKTATLVASGHTAATAAIPAKVAALTEGVVKAMLMTKLKTGAFVLLVLGMVALTCGMLAFGMANANGDDVEKPAAKVNEKPKDGLGDKENTLTVTIKPQKNRIRVNDPFKVDLRVVNSSHSPQSFRVMNCSWDEHWKSSNDRISWDRWDCAENSAVTVKLEPGDAYENTLPMLLVAGKPQENVSFKMGFTPIGSKQTYWSNEITVQVDQDKKEPRVVPIASYPSQDRPTEKRIRELLDAAKITFSSVGSRGQTVNVADDKAKQARTILEKAVVDGSLSVTVLDQHPVPKNLRAVRTDDKLRIEEDSASNEEVIVPVAAGLIRATDCEMSVYRGKERITHTGGTYRPAFDFSRAATKIPQPGDSYEIELVVKWFETDAPIRPNWAPQSGGKYKVLVTRTLKLSIGPENTKAVPPKNFTNSIGMKFVWIPPGNFMMGSPREENERWDDETQHKVTLTKGFYMGVYTVTQKEWKVIMGVANNPSRFKGEKNLPVETVWEDCQEYIKKLRDHDKKPYRLPTDAEWEYACRAGTTTPFHFGENISTDQVNYDGGFPYANGKIGESRRKWTPVGSFPANGWGLHDMHGNVWQWCHDCYREYSPKDVSDPRGPDKGGLRVLRGGSFNNPAGMCRSAERFWIKEHVRANLGGFRVCFFVE